MLLRRTAENRLFNSTLFLTAKLILYIFIYQSYVKLVVYKMTLNFKF